ncbi:MAG: hypothetical protein AAGD25_34805 [Cyanobacteria bacterium P01_F01_bin.150]
MIGDKITENFQPPAKGGNNRYQRNVPKAQQTVFNYLLDIVHKWPPEQVLDEFKHLFVHHVNTSSSVILPALYEIVFANKEIEFRNTLKRSCYILINNWDLGRHHEPIRQLIALFEDPIIQKKTPSPTLKRLRTWLQNFLKSRDFEELRLFATKYDQSEHWSSHYTPYLLVPQYTNLENSVEQREAARTLSRQLKEKFKVDLAFYTVLADTLESRIDKPENPTLLGDESLRLIKRIVARRGVFSYENLANIFKKQTQEISYSSFKLSLKDYLIYSLTKNECVQYLDQHISGRLEHLYSSYDDKTINDALLLRTCNRIIEYLTTEDHQTPSELFLTLMAQGNPLTLVIVLLKIVLLCRHVRTHLESRIADLVRYYEQLNEEDCKWIISFFEIFRITMTIHAENIEYTLVRMAEKNKSFNSSAQSKMNRYRIFSRVRKQIIDYESDADYSSLSHIEVMDPAKD